MMYPKWNKYNLILISLLLISIRLFSQEKNIYSVGLNTSFLHNKFTVGVNILYKNKKSIYFSLNGNIGLTGYKQFDELIYEKTDSFKVGNSNIYSYSYNIPNYYETPYEQTIEIPVNSGGYLNNYKAKIIGSFLNFSLGIPINHKKTFYTGTNILYFWNTDKGNYTYTTTYPTQQRITKKIYAQFETLGLGFFFSYMYHLNKRIIILPQLNFNFYFPITNENYGVSDGSNPLVGSEIDLSISINYKF